MLTSLMNIIPSEKLLALREQTIEDAVSGLTIKIDAAPDGTPRLMIHGALHVASESLYVIPRATSPAPLLDNSAVRASHCKWELLRKPRGLHPDEAVGANETLQKLVDSRFFRVILPVPQLS